MKDYVSMVDTNIGTIGHLLTSTAPTVLMPHGMMKAEPQFNPSSKDRYLSDKIYSFSVGFAAVMPTLSCGGYADNASAFDHDFETASPCEYSALLEDSGITASVTADSHSAIFRFDLPAAANVMLYVQESVRFDGRRILVGEDAPRSGRTGVDIWGDKNFAVGTIEFSKDFTVRKTATDLPRHDCWVLRVSEPGSLFVKCARSYIDIDQAAENLRREIPDFDYDAVLGRCRDAWNEKLARVRVWGGDEASKRCLYTALYRVMSRMECISEYGRYWSGYDNSVHDDEGHAFYTNDGMWDTFRCAHPLQQMLEPEVHRDIVESYIRMYRQSGWMPLFPRVTGERAIMLGNHTAPFFLDSAVRGMEFDLETAYEGVRKNAMERTMLPWSVAGITELDRCYFEKGFFPALGRGEKEYIPEVHSFENRQCVAVTLEHAFDDWCTARMAEMLGRAEDAEYFYGRAKNYRNLFNSETGFMSPKTIDGNWLPDFDPYNDGGQGGRAFFAENNAWIYTFNVMHDNEGLISLFGGADGFNSKLDRLFTEQPRPNKFHYLAQFPDSTGLVGQFPMGNEPSFHIPYLYNYSGQPHKTQRRVRELMKLWFTDTPLGICGDEDGGAMSAWFVYSALGFYPVCPGSGVYDLGSPIFDRAVISDGKTEFEIVAEGASGRKKYVSQAFLNGAELSGVRFDVGAVSRGGRLTLEMSERP